MKQQPRALDVTQKPIAESSAAMCPFDQTGDVGDNKGAKVAEINDA